MPIRFFLLFLLYTVSIFSQDNFLVNDSSLYRKAEQICKDFLIIDTHNDLPGWLYGRWFDVSQKSDRGEIDYVRALEGGLDAAFMSVYTPPELEGTGKAKLRADSQIVIINKIEKEWPDKFAVITSVSELKEQINKDRLLLPIGMENGSPIENNIKNVEEFYNKGVRYITLCHYKWNHISDSANDPEEKWNGLSPFGEDVVREMNRLGIIIDVSHVSDSAFYDIIKLSKVPVIASHSGCRYFTPRNKRNMSDEMIKTLAEHDGVININFASFFLVNDIFEKMEKGEDEIKKYLAENNISPDSAEADKYSGKYWEENPLGKASVKDVADHIDHVVKIAGVEHVGIGSDFNGVGGYVPAGLEDVSKFPNLVYELLSRGYSEADLRKILGGNTLRVWEKVEKNKY